MPHTCHSIFLLKEICMSKILRIRNLYQFMFSDSALFFMIHFTTVPQSTGRWASSVHCGFTVTSVRRTNKKILKSNNVITENNPGTTYIPTKAIWTEARDIIISTSSIKSNSIFTTRGRTPLWLDKIKQKM
jgi:hypothetical protein